MIVTVTLNPAVDKTGRAGRLIPGEVNRMREVISEAGGKGINVTKVLRQFHLPVAALGFLGGYSGRMIEEGMMKLGVECHFTRTKGDTRMNMNIVGDDGYVTELLEPGPVISEKELSNFRKEFEYCMEQCRLMVFSGSIPQGVPVDIYAQLIAACKKEGIRTVLDTSGEPLKEGVKAKPYLLKPNKKELEYLVGKRLASKDEVIEEAKRLVEEGISKVVVSMGEQGLLYVDGGQVIFEEAKKVKAVNTVGCGDSVVASLCMSEVSGETADIAMKKASALAAANAATRGSAEIVMSTYLDLL